MIDIASVVQDLEKARRARIDAELACCDIEELAETVRLSRASTSFLRRLWKEDVDRRDETGYDSKCPDALSIRCRGSPLHGQDHDPMFVLVNPE